MGSLPVSLRWGSRPLGLALLLLVAACGTPAKGSANAALPDRGSSTGRPAGTHSSDAQIGTAPTPSATDSSAADVSTAEAAAARCATSTLARMAPAQRAGQVLIVGVPAGAALQGSDLVRADQVGGVFLHGRSTISRVTLAGQVAGLQGITRGLDLPALHVAVDQEGGAVQTLSGTGFGAIPSALVQGSWDPATLRQRATDWSQDLHSAGVTLNFAPVADTVSRAAAAGNPPIGALDRQLGYDPTTVARAVTVLVGSSQGTGVLATLKHYPGLGRVTVNTDFSAQATDGVADGDDAYLAPFEAGVRAGAGAVMMSLARYPRLDAANVAALSSRVIGQLRHEQHFDGLVVSDDLGDAVAVQKIPIGQRAVDFVAAGGDLALTVRATDAGPMRAALMAAAATSPTLRSSLDRAALDVLKSKYRVGELTCPGDGVDRKLSRQGHDTGGAP